MCKTQDLIVGSKTKTRKTLKLVVHTLSFVTEFSSDTKLWFVLLSTRIGPSELDPGPHSLTVRSMEDVKSHLLSCEKSTVFTGPL